MIDVASADHILLALRRSPAAVEIERQQSFCWRGIDARQVCAASSSPGAGKRRKADRQKRDRNKRVSSNMDSHGRIANTVVWHNILLTHSHQQRGMLSTF
jgi:hypothetical protein